MFLLPLLLLQLLSLPSARGESCLVESHRCSFPFNSGSPESNHYSCQPSNRTDGSTEHFCYSQIGNRHVYGVCSSECYQTDGETPIQFEEDDPMAFFCKTAASECQFPFTWNGQEYSQCTNQGSDFHWCALEVDQEGLMVGNKWGKCDMSKCDVTTVEEPQEARAVFDERLQGLILFSQESSTHSVVLEGKLSGLDDGEYSLKVSSSPCGTNGPELGSVKTVLARDNVTTISLEAWEVSLYPDSSDYLVGGSVRLEEACSPLLSENSDCDVVKTLACANVQLGKGDNFDINLILMVTLIVFSILLLILSIILIISCYRRFCPRRKQNLGEDSLGSCQEIYRDSVRKSKTPLYDELSIPFIDASLPPTPKVGRSSNPLEILLGKVEGSNNSLNECQPRN